MRIPTITMGILAQIALKFVLVQTILCAINRH
jgi:hypothetical protein